MTQVNELSALIKSYCSQMDIGVIDAAAAKAESGQLEDKFDFVQAMAQVLDTAFGWKAEDRVMAKKMLLTSFEELAEAGHVMAMRATAFGYARGDNDQKISDGAGGQNATSKPDFATAFLWASKAAEKGDAVATELLPDIKEQMKLQLLGR